mmetsp:Transcript_96490/g.210995  ORF Transcript_96490/g.210995 Transcript_96490/m.210995 type:complete len:367 (-) Transcript_96490:156-1256(-)
MTATAAVTSDKVRFHVVGDVLMDVLATGLPRIPNWEEDTTADSVQCQPGGSAFNTAVHLASLIGKRGSVCFHGCVGCDSFGALLRSKLVECQVEPHLIERPLLSTGSCLVLSGGDEVSSGRSFVTCSGASGTLVMEDLAEVLREELMNIEPASRVHIHWGGCYDYNSTLRTALPNSMKELRHLAESRGVALSLSADPNATDAHHIEGLAETLDQLDLFKGNHTEARLLTGESDTKEALKEIVARGVGRCSAAITAGGQGASCLLSPMAAAAAAAAAASTAAASAAAATGVKAVEISEIAEVGSFHVKAYDCTGAGDACSAGLLAGWAGLRMPLQQSLRLGCAAGRKCLEIARSSPNSRILSSLFSS